MDAFSGTGPPLVSVSGLTTALGSDSPPTLLDVRWRLGGPPARHDYDAGHLPGASFVDLDRDLAEAPGTGGRHPLPDAVTFGAAMRACGVDADRDIVVYDAADALSASRAWWMLGFFGHRHVRVLDGGLTAWRAAGLPLLRDPPAQRVGKFEAIPHGRPLVDAAAAAQIARRGVLLDARSGERFRGEKEAVDRVAGHIPGARSAPTTENLRPDGRLREPAELRARFAALGVVPGTPVAAYCGSGVTAAHEVLALELAGIRAGLYVGSWSDWITDAGRPVATGP